MNTPPDSEVVSQFDVLPAGTPSCACWQWLYEMRGPLAEEVLLCQAAGPAQATLLQVLRQRGPEEALRKLCQDLMLAGDMEAVCAAHLGAIAAVFDSGHDFGDFHFWLSSAAMVDGQTDDVSAQGRGALMLHCALAQLIGNANLPQARQNLAQLALLADEADCDALRICHAATSACLEIMCGRLLVADALLKDALHLSPEPCSHPVPKLWLQASCGLLSQLCGGTDDARLRVESAARHPQFDQLPAPLWFCHMRQALLSLASSATGDDALSACAEKMRARSIPQHKHYHRSCLHHSLGTVALVMGQPETALFHAQAAVELSRFCHSVSTEDAATLLAIQALNDLGRHDKALMLLEKQVADWHRAGANLLLACAAIEEASLQLARGRVAEARHALWRAHHTLPPGEGLPHNLRSRHFIAELASRLDTQHATYGPHDPGGHPVQITTFGELRVEINGRTLYDRDWHGNRSKTLLKALIVLGGHKVSAERLCDLLWPDADGDIARNNLKVSLWRLRRLGCNKDETPLPWIAVQHGHVSLVGSLCRVDCIEFEAALQAALASGTPQGIAEVLAPITANFLGTDDSTLWVIEHRENLRRQYLQAVYTLADLTLKHPLSFNPLPILETAVRLAHDDHRCQALLARFQFNTT